MKKVTVSTGKIILSIVAVYSAFGSYLFDWNRTHIYNPAWPPHAKFHNAQTMLLGTCLGLLSLCTIWFENLSDMLRLKYAASLASFYWLTQMGSLLFPGTALFDPEFAPEHKLPEQLIVDLVMLLLVCISVVLERRHLLR